MSFINLLRTRSGSISQGEIYNVKIVEDTSFLSRVVNSAKKQESTFPSDFNVTFKEGYYYNIRHIVDTNTNTDIQYVLPDGFTGSIYFSSISYKMKMTQKVGDDGTISYLPSLDMFNFINLPGTEEEQQSAKLTFLTLYVMAMDETEVCKLTRFDNGNVDSNYSQNFNVSLKRNQITMSVPITVSYSKNGNSKGQNAQLRSWSGVINEDAECDYLPILEGAADSTFELEVNINAV